MAKKGSAKRGAGATANGAGVAAVDRALAILAAFRPGDESLSLATLADRTGLYKSTILRLVASLERARYARRLDDGRYGLGPEPLRLAQVYQDSFRIRDAVMPVLRALADDFGETASLYVREGGMRVCLHRVEPTRQVRVALREGERLPLDRGAAGKVLLAFSGDPAKRFDEVRSQRYAASFGERDPEIAAIAAPVFGADGKLEGALNLSGPRERLRPERIEAIRPQLLVAAARLTHELGGSPTAYGASITARAFRR